MILARLRAALTYSNTISTIALFFALGGGLAWALELDSVFSKHIVDGQVRAADIGRDQVGSVAIADGAVGASELAPVEPPRFVGTVTPPDFGNGGEGDCQWRNLGAAGSPTDPIAFYKDPLGIVHLEGTAQAFDGPGGDKACNPSSTGDAFDGIVFILPPGYRPANVDVFPPGGVRQLVGSEAIIVAGVAETPIGGPAGVTLPPGAVVAPLVTTPGNRPAAVLGGITFRAG
jgi:hypothetical protein